MRLEQIRRQPESTRMIERWRYSINLGDTLQIRGQKSGRRRPTATANVADERERDEEL